MFCDLTENFKARTLPCRTEGCSRPGMYGPERKAVCSPCSGFNDVYCGSGVDSREVFAARGRHQELKVVRDGPTKMQARALLQRITVAREGGWAEDCRHGHVDCSHRDGGPCSTELESLLGEGHK